VNFWWLDRTLPGIVGGVAGSAVVAVAVWVSHRLLKRHIEKLTADQTATLTARPKLTRPAKRLLDDYPGPRPEPPESG
jgi:hypothetical protein